MIDSEIFPKDLTKEFNERKKILDEYLECIISHNSNIDIFIRLKLGFLIESLYNNSSFSDLNNVIENYINIFLDMGIKLDVLEFNYSDTVRKYMNSFFSNKHECNNIFIECKDFISQIKNSLIEIVYKYNNELDSALVKKTDDKVQTFPASNLNLYDDYLFYKNEYNLDLISDPYYNYMFFHNNEKEESYLIYKNNILKFYPSYNDLNNDKKKEVNNLFIDCYNELGILIEYYRYQFMVDVNNINNTIYEKFEMRLNSFYFLKKLFDYKFSDEKEYDFYEEFNRLIEFIYSPYNKVLKNTCIGDVCDILITKYNNLGFKFTIFDLKDNIFDTYEIFKYIIRYNFYKLK